MWQLELRTAGSIELSAPLTEEGTESVLSNGLSGNDIGTLAYNRVLRPFLQSDPTCQPLRADKNRRDDYKSHTVSRSGFTEAGLA